MAAAVDVMRERLMGNAQNNGCQAIGGRRPRDAALIYAENRLHPWADWARENRAGLGYPTIALLYKAMRQKAVPLRERRLVNHGKLTARGAETHSFLPQTIGEVPEAIMEVDTVVAALPHDLHAVIIADCFTYGPIEERCRRTPWKRARYSQLLEAAKYAIYTALSSRTESVV